MSSIMMMIKEKKAVWLSLPLEMSSIIIDQNKKHLHHHCAKNIWHTSASHSTLSGTLVVVALPCEQETYHLRPRTCTFYWENWCIYSWTPRLSWVSWDSCLSALWLENEAFTLEFPDLLGLLVLLGVSVSLWEMKHLLLKSWTFFGFLGCFPYSLSTVQNGPNSVHALTAFSQ